MLTLWSESYNQTLCEVKDVFARMTASVPYAKEKGDSPVELLAIVRYAHNTSGSLSARLPFFSSSFAFNVCFITLFTASVWLLVYR